MKFRLCVACVAALLLNAGAGTWIARGQTESVAGAKTDNPVVLRFAVSGDSRNCGDVVMPGITAKVQEESVRILLASGGFSRHLRD